MHRSGWKRASLQPRHRLPKLGVVLLHAVVEVDGDVLGGDGLEDVVVGAGVGGFFAEELQALRLACGEVAGVDTIRRLRWAVASLDLDRDLKMSF